MLKMTKFGDDVTLWFPEENHKAKFDELLIQHGTKLHSKASVCPVVSPVTESFVPVESISLGIKFNVHKQHKNYMRSVLRVFEQLSKSQEPE